MTLTVEETTHCKIMFNVYKFDKPVKNEQIVF